MVQCLGTGVDIVVSESLKCKRQLAGQMTVCAYAKGDWLHWLLASLTGGDSVSHGMEGAAADSSTSIMPVAA